MGRQKQHWCIWLELLTQVFQPTEPVPVRQLHIEANETEYVVMIGLAKGSCRWELLKAITCRSQLCVEHGDLLPIFLRVLSAESLDS